MNFLGFPKLPELETALLQAEDHLVSALTRSLNDLLAGKKVKVTFNMELEVVDKVTGEVATDKTTKG